MPPRIPSGTAISVAVPVMTSVPTTAGPIPPPALLSTIGMSEVRKSTPKMLPPLLITKMITRTSGTIAMTTQIPMSTVASTLRALRPLTPRLGSRIDRR